MRISKIAMSALVVGMMLCAAATSAVALPSNTTGYMVEVHTCAKDDSGTDSTIDMILDIRDSNWHPQTLIFRQNICRLNGSTSIYNDHERDQWNRYFFPTSKATHAYHIEKLYLISNGEGNKPGWCWDRHYVTYIEDSHSIWTWAWEQESPWIYGGTTEYPFTYGDVGRPIPSDLHIVTDEDTNEDKCAPSTTCPWYNPICWVQATWDGIKSGAGWVWQGAKTAGSAIKTAASESWNGTKVLAGWIEKGAEWSADKFVEVCHRTFEATCQQVNTLVNSMVTMGYGTLESVQIMTEGMKELAKGNFVDGTAALYVGLAKFGYEMPLDVLLSEAIETLSTLQTVLFLEPEGRFLTAAEKSYLSSVFRGKNWWLDLIRVKEGFSGIWSLHPNPFTVETTIYLKNWPSD